MTENRKMTILLKGRTERDLLSVLERQNIQFKKEMLGNQTILIYQGGRDLIKAIFENGICEKVLTKTIDKLS